MVPDVKEQIMDLKIDRSLQEAYSGQRARTLEAPPEIEVAAVPASPNGFSNKIWV
jgi:hypothetical protein